MTNRKKALLGASATIAVWATAFPFSKIALQSVDSLTLSVARVMGGALLMLVIGVVKGLHIPTTWREWKGHGWRFTYAGNRCCKRATYTDNMA
ncbi:MAG: EamA family transporter [Clostridium sp.]|nr:EamA family transporter [Clostridium sp.]